MTTQPLQATDRRHGPTGVILGLGAAVALSMGGLLLRSIEVASGWQILVYRSASFALLVFAIVVIQNRGRVIRPFLDIGWSGVMLSLIHI